MAGSQKMGSASSPAVLLILLLAVVSADAQILRVATLPEYSTLVSLLKGTDLLTTVAGLKNVTVFAPNNSAFAALPNKTLQCLTSGAGKPLLSTVLKYHVAQGYFPLSVLTGAAKAIVPTLAMIGTATQTEVVEPTANGGVTVNNVTVVAPDVVLDTMNRAVVHGIASVLLPAGAGSLIEQTCSLVPGLQADSNYSTLVSLLVNTSLVKPIQDLIAKNGAVTIFAPTNAAFQAALGTATLDCLTKTPAGRNLLATILQYHVVPGNYNATGVLTSPSLTSINNLTLPINASAVTVAGVKISKPDAIVNFEGTVHTVAAVLLPPNGTALLASTCGKASAPAPAPAPSSGEAPHGHGPATVFASALLCVTLGLLSTF